jgi:hypothetical protein
MLFLTEIFKSANVPLITRNEACEPSNFERALPKGKD